MPSKESIPEAIREAYRERVRGWGDPRSWRGRVVEVAYMPTPMLPITYKPTPVTMEKVTYHRFLFEYRTWRHPTHTVEAIECQGMRLWERTTAT